MIMIHIIWLIAKVDRLDFMLWIWNADADVVICVGRLLHLCFRPSVLAIRPIKSIQFTPFCCYLLLSAILRAIGAKGQFPPPPSDFGQIFKTETYFRLKNNISYWKTNSYSGITISILGSGNVFPIQSSDSFQSKNSLCPSKLLLFDLRLLLAPPLSFSDFPTALYYSANVGSLPCFHIHDFYLSISLERSMLTPSSAEGERCQIQMGLRILLKVFKQLKRLNFNSF